MVGKNGFNDTVHDLVPFISLADGAPFPMSEGLPILHRIVSVVDPGCVYQASL